MNERRKELNANLSLLCRQLESEDRMTWVDDVAYDAAQRKDRIEALALPPGRVYSTVENQAVERCLGMFALFNNNSAGTTPLKHSATIARSEVKQDPATGLLLGRAEAEIRAHVLEIIAYLLNDEDSRFIQSIEAALPEVGRAEVLEIINAHHTVTFSTYQSSGLQNRTFLNSIVAKQVAEDPPTYVVAMVPIPSHAKIGPNDEAGAIRAESVRSFRCTELAAGLTRLEFSCSLDLRGWVPQMIVDKLAIPGQMECVNTLQRYFQQVRRLSECNADDGRLVGLMLLEIVNSQPKDLAHAVRQFASRANMLRECGLRFIGEMLAGLLCADAQSAPIPLDDQHDAAIVVLDPSSVTEKQALAIGSAIASSVHKSRMPATALLKVVQSHAVLRAMKSLYVWFVPMLEVLVACTDRDSRRRSSSNIMKRLSSIVVAVAEDTYSEANVAAVNATLCADSDEAHEERDFSSVV